MLKVLIGSTNNGKIEGAKKAFSHYYNELQINGIAVDSEVNEQPLNEEILTGAKNRVKNLKKYAKEHKISADFYIAVESGISNQLDEWVIIQMAYIEDNKGNSSYGTSPAFPVPQRFVNDIITSDLSVVMKNLFKENNLKLGKGGISFVTNDVVSRIDLTESAFVMALTKFVCDKWTDKEN